jgi:hypothetical protein
MEIRIFIIMKITAVLDTVLRILVKVDWRFGGAHCLLHQDGK